MANLSDAQLVELRTELDTDPNGRGYAGMDDVTAQRDINTLYVAWSQAIEAEAFENAIRSGGKWTEFQERADLQSTPGTYDNPSIKELMDVFGTRILNMDLRGIAPQGGANDTYWPDLLDACVAEGSIGSAAAEAIKALSDTTTSRATELGWPTVTTQDVTLARAL